MPEIRDQRTEVSKNQAESGADMRRLPTITSSEPSRCKAFLRDGSFISPPFKRDGNGLALKVGPRDNALRWFPAINSGRGTIDCGPFSFTRIILPETTK